MTSCPPASLWYSTFDAFNERIGKIETALHKLVRAISRRCEIIYESTDGSFEYDEVIDPLPFDINADVIDIADRDYAIWYRDLSENMPAH